MTNGITTRRWLLQANPQLATLITSKLGSDDWLLDAAKLQGLSQFAENLEFQKQWNEIKVRSPRRELVR